MRNPTVTRMLPALTLIATGVMIGPASAQQIPPIVISSQIPSDIPGGAPNANLTAAPVFAWQEFIALTWPARTDVREAPDTSQPFGRNGTAGGSPLVWQTLRHKVEIFPSREMSNITDPLPVPHGSNQGLPDYGYDQAP